MRYGPGNPPKLDEEAKNTVRQQLRALQSATDTRGPTPAKSKKVASLLIGAAKDTLLRAGKTTFSRKVTMSESSIAFFRADVGGIKRKAKDISDARWKALTSSQHMYQSAVVLTATLGHLKATQKGNFDCTTMELAHENSGKVRWLCFFH